MVLYSVKQGNFRYVIKRYLEEESPFFDKIFPPTYLLSTSQTPLNQCEQVAFFTLKRICFKNGW